MILEKQFTSTHIHDGGLSDFDINDGIVLSLHDSKLIQYSLIDKEVKHTTQLEMTMNTVCIHPANRTLFALGGTRVETYDDVEMITPNLIAQINEHINYIGYSHDGQYMCIASEENNLSVYSQATQKVTKCRPGHDGMTIGGAFDPKDRFVASIGCDGCLIIYQLSENPTLLQRYTVSKQLSPDGLQRMKCSWHPSGSFLSICGKLNMQYINTEDEPQEIQISYQVMHESEICLIEWVNEHCLITCSLDGQIKMWHFKSLIDISLHWKICINMTPLTIRVQGDIYILDNGGNIIQTALDAPQTDYEKIYSSKQNALQDLLQRKSKKIEQQQQHQHIDQSEQSIHEIHQDKQIISESIQNIIRPSETSLVKGRRYLCYNHVGTIVQCSTSNILEFEFFDSMFYKKFKLQNTKNYSMASMNYRGCVLASKGPNDVNQEGYLENDNDGNSTVFFQQFISDIDDFEIELPNEEGAEVVAIGNDWFSVLSDHGIVRIFGFSGIQISELQINKPCVSMCAYEQLLCLVYHDTMTMLDSQILRCKLYDVEQRHYCRDIDIIIAPMSTLKWIAFSEEGMLMTQDSKGSIRIYLFEEQRWQLVLRDKKTWVFAMSDYKIEALQLEDEDEPTATQRYHPLTLNMAPDVINSSKEDKVGKLLLQCSIKDIILTHETYRQHTFGHLYHSRIGVDDILNKYTANMYDESKLGDLQQQLRKHKFEIFAVLIGMSIDKGVEYFRSHLRTDLEMNQAISLLERQKDKSKQTAKVIVTLRTIQRQCITKQQYIKAPVVIMPTSPKGQVQQSFGLQKQQQPMKSAVAVEPLVIKTMPKTPEAEEIQSNPFANSGYKAQVSIFDVDGAKRKPVFEHPGSEVVGLQVEEEQVKEEGESIVFSSEDANIVAVDEWMQWECLLRASADQKHIMLNTLSATVADLLDLLSHMFQAIQHYEQQSAQLWQRNIEQLKHVQVPLLSENFALKQRIESLNNHQDDSLFKQLKEYSVEKPTQMKVIDLDNLKRDQNFQEEFMSKFNEFSLSWRQEALQLKHI